MSKAKAPGPRRLWIPALILALAAFIFFNNASIFAQGGGTPFLMAHRGLGQTFPMEAVTGSSNTAAMIDEPEHEYIENTLPSMEAAFSYGADMVELDVQLTGDGRLAVFHDAVLEYRTDGQGSVRDHTMDELRTLDVGYGYTADGGRSYPFRGRGTGLMPTLDEVLDAFPQGAFLIHVKSNDPLEGEALAALLETLPHERLERLAAYGGDEPMDVVSRRIPELRVMSRAAAKKALISYMLVGWTGVMPASMGNTFLYLPEKYARFLWGWPGRFTERMDRAGSLFVLTAGEGQWSEGFDSADDLTALPEGYDGGIWTNRIDRIGPIFKGTRPWTPGR